MSSHSCFPHVINIAVQTALKDLKESVPEALQDDVGYWKALAGDAVGRARTVVSAVRSSGQRRADFHDVIEEHNREGASHDPPEFLRVVTLLREVETRWSSTFLMIDRVVELLQAVNEFLALDKYEDLRHLQLSDDTVRVLIDIRRFLFVFHVIQELVSAQKTPTLPIVLPLYEKLIVLLESLKEELPKITPTIDIAKQKISEYLGLARHTKIYALAMGESYIVQLFFALLIFCTQ
ncbi:hypothetical protein C8J56DRAFT_789034 [Mycena floridula]|nr:hypothetical protein C8J56DRAFT_789034 [Mycena floridula]